MPQKYTSASRIISSEIIDDRRVNNLPDFVTIVAHFRILLRMDNIGRIEAEPEMIKSLIFPRKKPPISLIKCQNIVKALHDHGLFFLYKHNDDQFLQAAKYDRQKMVGHMQRKSSLPPPDAEKFIEWLIKTRKDDRFTNGNNVLDTCLDHVQTMLGTCINNIIHVKTIDLAIKEEWSEHVNTMLIPCSEHVNPEQEQIMNRTDNDNDNDNDNDTEEEGDSLTEPDLEENQTDVSGVSVSVDTEILEQVKDAALKNLDNASLPKNGNLEKELTSAIQIHGWRNVEEAIKEAVLRNNPRWPYVIGILENWAKERDKAKAARVKVRGKRK